MATSVKVSTTLPRDIGCLPAAGVSRYTNRLILRPLVESDLDSYRSLRVQYGAMKDAFGGKDESIDDTRDRLKVYTNHKTWEEEGFSSIFFGIFLKLPDGNEGELIGEGGVDVEKEVNWPNVIYAFKKEHWGKGFATEFLEFFLEYWWGLPRENTTLTLDVDKWRLDTQDVSMTEELLCASVSEGNAASLRVLEKRGFEKCTESLGHIRLRLCKTNGKD